MARYWAKRSEARMEQYLRDSQDTLDILAAAHAKATRDIQEDIAKIHRRVGILYGLTPEDVRELLDRPAGADEIAELLRLVSLMPEGAERTLLEARAASGAYSYRVTRLEALEGRIQARVAALADLSIGATEKGLTHTVYDAYSRSMFDLQAQAGHFFSFAPLNARTVTEVLRNPWSGNTFSRRIWGNAQALETTLRETVTAGFLSGQSVARMSEAISQRMGVSYRAAERLVRTETCYMANAGEIQAYKEAGIERYQFLATLDDRTSDICQELDGQEFLVAEAMAGLNLPPMHPHCRSTTIAVLDQAAREGLMRRARDPATGKIYEVPRSMTYSEWKRKYAEGLTVSSVNAKMQHTKDSGDVKAIQVFGKLAVDAVQQEFGKLKTLDVVLTDERQEHIRSRHPEDFALFEVYGKAIIEAPDIVLVDEKNAATIFALKKLPQTNLNVIIRLALSEDRGERKNSIMTFYRVRDKNLVKLLRKNKVLYRKEEN